MDSDDLSDADVIEQVTQAVEQLLAHETDLLVRNTNERTITHRLAVHMEGRFPAGLQVDCEYNKNGHGPKRLRLPVDMVASDDPNGSPVYPDIVVHRRGNNDTNLAVIEAKKSTNPVPHERDHEKLRAFQEQLGYRVAVFLLLRTATKRPGATLTFTIEDAPPVVVELPRETISREPEVTF